MTGISCFNSLLFVPSMGCLFISHALPLSCNSRLSHRFTLSPRPHALVSFANYSKNNFRAPPSEDQSENDPSLEKVSLAATTGKLFLGIASRLIKSSLSYEDSTIPVYRRLGKRIGVLMEDEIEPEGIWEQRVKDIEAEKERTVITTPGFSFSGGGFLLPYHLGAAQFLIEKGYIKETTPLAGSSAGAIVCAVIASGATMDEALKVGKILGNDCRLNGTTFRLGTVLRNLLYEHLPDDTHTKSNGRIRVAITQILWRPRGLLVDQFDSKEDLINAVITSSFIPGYVAPRPATIFRNRLCLDGGLTLFMPPTSASKTVRVSAFPASWFGLQGIEISPDCNPENRATRRKVFKWAREPGEDEIFDRLFELGYVDAAVWGEQNPVEGIVADERPLALNGSGK